MSIVETTPAGEPTPSLVTPLPWDWTDEVLRFSDIYAYLDSAYAIYSPNDTDDKDEPIAFVMPRFSGTALTNARYLVHAANAPPTLTARVTELESALRGLLNACEFLRVEGSQVTAARKVLEEKR
jgi:hypothetical protein